MPLPLNLLITTATRTKRFKSESDLVAFVNGLTTTTAVNITITQAATVSLVEKDTINFGTPQEGDIINLIIAGVTFSYTVLFGDTELLVATAIKALIDAEILANPGGAVDSLIVSSVLASIKIEGRNVNTPLLITGSVITVPLKSADFTLVNSIPTDKTARNYYDTWILFYHLI